MALGDASSPRLEYVTWLYPSTTDLTMALYAEAMAMFDDAQDAEVEIAEETAGMTTHEQQQQEADGHDQQLAPPSQRQAKDPMVREPTSEDVASWTSLQQVAKWANLK